MTKYNLIKEVSENSGLNIVDVEINDTMYGIFKCREILFLTLHRKYKVVIFEDGKIIDLIGRLVRNDDIIYHHYLFSI